MQLFLVPPSGGSGELGVKLPAEAGTTNTKVTS